MLDISTGREWYKKRSFVLLAFCCVTLIMLITRYLSFYTFKGSDDLHYAFLSNQVLNGSYEMFFAQDIYAGRTAIIMYQALWFKLFGINDFSMCMPSLSALVILAYLVCFKCGLQKNAGTILPAASLVYFNPVVTRSTLGNLPDVYIALIAVLVFLLIKGSTGLRSVKQHSFRGFIVALLLLAGLFVKETIVLVYAGTAFLLFYYRKEVSRHFVAAIAGVVIVGVAGYLLFYYVNTGDIFYRFVQIKNAAYFNGCSYQCLPLSALLKRLTVNVPLVAVLTGAFPLLLAASVLLAKNHNTTGARFWKLTFILLLLPGLYFPFSIAPYIPLCHDMRQFFFLFPFAAVLFTVFLQDEKNIRSINLAGSVVFVLATFLCLLYEPYNKWLILCNGLLALVFILNIFSGKKLQQFFFCLAIPAILWLSTAYPLYKKPHHGYSELKTLSGELKKQKSFIGNTYYFLNNDTKTHFALINQFDTTKRFLTFDTLQSGFKPFLAYQHKDAFNNIQNGWLILGDAYLEDISPAATRSIKPLLEGKFYSVSIHNTTAYYITSAETANEIIQIINSNRPSGNCY